MLGDEAKERSSGSLPGPEASPGDTRVVRRGMSNTQHECDDPASQTNFNAHVGKEEGGADPSDLGFEGLLQSAVLAVGVPRMIVAIYLTSLVPECYAETDKFDNRSADLGLSVRATSS